LVRKQGSWVENGMQNCKSYPPSKLALLLVGEEDRLDWVEMSRSMDCGLGGVVSTWRKPGSFLAGIALWVLNGWKLG
jgi:hypothetical protein